MIDNKTPKPVSYHLNCPMVFGQIEVYFYERNVNLKCNNSF
jgi:hypothetical protein